MIEYPAIQYNPIINYIIIQWSSNDHPMIHFNIQSSSNSFYWHSPSATLISSLFRPGISGRNVANLSRLVALSKCLGTTERERTERIGFRTQAILEGHCKQQRMVQKMDVFFFGKLTWSWHHQIMEDTWIRWRFRSFHLAQTFHLIPSNSPELRSHVAASPTKAMMTVHSPGASSILWSDGPAQATLSIFILFLGGKGKDIFEMLKLSNIVQHCPTHAS